MAHRTKYQEEKTNALNALRSFAKDIKRNNPKRGINVLRTGTMKTICEQYAEFLEVHQLYYLAEFCRNVGRYAEDHTKEQTLQKLTDHFGQCFYYNCTIQELQKRISKI